MNMKREELDKIIDMCTNDDTVDIAQLNKLINARGGRMYNPIDVDAISTTTKKSKEYWDSDADLADADVCAAIDRECEDKKQLANTEQKERTSSEFYMTYYGRFARYKFALPGTLTSVEHSILEWLKRHATMCSDGARGGGNMIFLSSWRRDEIAHDVGCSASMVNKTIPKLAKLYVIRSIPGKQGLYQLNPWLFASGSVKAINRLRESKAYVSSKYKDGDINAI